MKVTRLLRHLFTTRWRTRRAFTAAVLTQIEAEIGVAEATHEGEIRFVVESALPWPVLWRDLTPRRRALQVFAHLHMWDTHANSGVLIYVDMADHAVEIVADRGIAAQVPEAQWQQVCRDVEQHYRASQFADGSRIAVAGVARLLRQHFPAAGPNVNELPNQPILL
jgi:uncharacterized membrane protein